MRFRILAVLLFVLAFAGAASAQAVPTANILGPTDSLRVTWPLPTSSPDGLDVPTGVRVKATNPSGTVIRSWDTLANVVTLNLTPTMIPSGPFTITIHPFNSFGEATASNSSGPFGKATAPKPLTGTSAVVVAGGQ